MRVVETLATASPGFAACVVEYPFGDICSRPGLGLRELEITIATALNGLAAEREVFCEAETALPLSS